MDSLSESEENESRDKKRKRTTKEFIIDDTFLLISGTVPCLNCNISKIACEYSQIEKKRGPLKHIDQLKILENRLAQMEELLLKQQLNLNNLHISDHETNSNDKNFNSNNLHTLQQTQKSAMNNNGITIVEDGTTETQRFFGSTSISSSSAVYQSPRYKNGVLKLYLQLDQRSLMELTGHDNLLCSTELTLCLINHYFNTFHCYFPMIDRAWFMRQFRDRQISGPFNLLLHAMCALVVQHTKSLKAWNIENHLDLHFKFIKKVKTLLPLYLDHPNLIVVQTLILLTICGLGLTEIINPWIYLGMSVRISFELGLHRNLSKHDIHLKVTENEMHTRKKTFFVCYILDRYCSILSGRPLGIRDDDWDTDYPTLEEFEEKVGIGKFMDGAENTFTNLPTPAPSSANSASSSPSSCASNIEPISVATDDSLEINSVKNLILHVELAKIFGEINNLENSAYFTGNKKVLLIKLKKDLEIWISKLPKFFLDGRFPEPVETAIGEIDFSKWSIFHSLSIMFHTCSILLTRLTSGKIDERCVPSATALLRILDHLPAPPSDVDGVGKIYFIFPVCSYGMLSASTCFLGDVIKGDFGAISYFRKLYLALKKMEGISTVCLRIRQIIDEIIISKGINVMELIGNEVFYQGLSFYKKQQNRKKDFNFEEKNLNLSCKNGTENFSSDMAKKDFLRALSSAGIESDPSLTNIWKNDFPQGLNHINQLPHRNFPNFNNPNYAFTTESISPLDFNNGGLTANTVNNNGLNNNSEENITATYQNNTGFVESILSDFLRAEYN
ncbi:hypothetical protein HDU92_000082 [Lobulomyces angularis]|nr:hypothetical protein HDU92_000082 [Lobulomyces angularis]